MTTRRYETESIRVTDVDAMDDFEAREMTFLGKTKTVYTSGTGPGVIVMAEMPGIYAHFLRFARIVRDAGFTVWIPALFGARVGPVSMLGGTMTLARACISREFNAFARDRSSPVTDWLLAPVLSQPSLPMRDDGGLDISPDDLETVKERLEIEDLTVLGYRFEGDRFCKAERFEALEAALGNRFEGVVLKDADALPGTPVRPHSVVTLHLVDDAGEPTQQAVDDIIAFFRMRLIES